MLEEHMASQLVKRPPTTQQKPLLSRSERYEVAKAIADLTFHFAYYLTPSRIPAILR